MNQKTGSSNDSPNLSKSSAPGDANATSSEQGSKTSSIEQIKGKAEHFAADLAGEAKKTAESKLGAGKDFAAEHLGSMAHALRVASRELHSADSPAVGYVDSAARGVESISDYFQTRTLSQLVGDIESYARREPAVFLGGAFFAGMLGGRFLKAASPARSTSQGGGAGQSSSFPSERRALPSPDQSGGQYGRSNGNDRAGGQDKGGQSHESSRAHSGADASAPTSGSASPNTSGSSSSPSTSTGTKNASSAPGGASSSTSSIKPSGESKPEDASKKGDKGPGGV